MFPSNGHDPKTSFQLAIPVSYKPKTFTLRPFFRLYPHMCIQFIKGQPLLLEWLIKEIQYWSIVIMKLVASADLYRIRLLPIQSRFKDLDEEFVRYHQLEIMDIFYHIAPRIKCRTYLPSLVFFRPIWRDAVACIKHFTLILFDTNSWVSSSKSFVALCRINYCLNRQKRVAVLTSRAYFQWCLAVPLYVPG